MQREGRERVIEESSSGAKWEEAGGADEEERVLERERERRVTRWLSNDRTEDKGGAGGGSGLRAG